MGVDLAAPPALDALPSDASGQSGEHSLSYAFGVGDGALSTWRSPADLDVSGDGSADAVALDFDGDGARDDAMWDSDGDGRADLAVIDRDGAARVYSDTGRGLWDHRVHDVVPAPGGGGPARGDDGSGHVDSRRPERGTDLDGDGTADDRIVDTDGTGRSRVGLVFAGGSGGSPTRVLIDLDGDQTFDAVVVDSDGDGIADGWFTRGQTGFAAPGEVRPRQSR